MWFTGKPDYKLLYELQRTKKELRTANAALRGKRKLSKALHEANKRIKQLEDYKEKYFVAVFGKRLRHETFQFTDDLGKQVKDVWYEDIKLEDKPTNCG